jgi:hypothetical protein
MDSHIHGRAPRLPRRSLPPRWNGPRCPTPRPGPTQTTSPPTSARAPRSAPRRTLTLGRPRAHKNRRAPQGPDARSPL